MYAVQNTFYCFQFPSRFETTSLRELEQAELCTRGFLRGTSESHAGLRWPDRLMKFSSSQKYVGRTINNRTTL